jgi:DNA-binding HxlR family transcriptional regulator
MKNDDQSNFKLQGIPTEEHLEALLKEMEQEGWIERFCHVSGETRWKLTEKGRKDFS